MKKIILSTVLAIAGLAAQAQNQANQNAAADQSTKLALSNAIDISFYSMYYGGTQTMTFNNVNDYANGVTTGWQILIVKSNKNYDVSVKTNAANFTYSGNTTPAPVMPVSALNVGLFINNTGGTPSNTFWNKFAPLDEAPQTLITNGQKGGFQYFFTRYKATPGFAYPAGTYTAEVIYTATQK
ncbi:MAG: hypothetical protein H6550_06485 [Chitinophagales bacterium]|nr:hypothetical protein [Chitinophagales bacterium]